ncbi:MarR family winged helix-turn-helix transcriptional regulator [Kutzneria sp. NPDC052558]|uniref:MarR family winged helix-turn-helix transcriptional regulator n=1 Tax=Kutzneria sp. NPDC052558 TaxID=3364121 RepID=UPI0037C64FE5
MAELEALPELIFEVADVLNLRAAGEAGLVDLPTSELTVLRLVTVFPGCGIVFLTDRTRMHQANVSATVRSLVRRGLIVKETDERDRRAVRLFPSEQADRDLESLRAVWRRRLTAAFDAAGIAERDRARLLTVLRETKRGLQSGSAG